MLTFNELWSFFKTAIFGHYHMWFLFAIMGLYIVTPLLRCITKSEEATKYFLAVSFICSVAIPFVTSFGHLSILSGLLGMMQIQVCVGYAFYYVLGYYLNQKTLPLPMRKIWLIACFFAGLLCTFILSQWASLSTGRPIATYYDVLQLSNFISAASIFMLFKNWKSRSLKLTRFVNNVSAASLGVYLIHPLILDLLHRVGYDSMMFPHPFISIPITAISVCVISFAIAAILKRIPIVKTYLV